MNYREKYKFGDFTIEKYRTLLLSAKENEFLFAFFYEPHTADSKQILWRHDVEFSPFKALRMAEIENEVLVKSTYFFQLHSEFYNVLEKEISGIVYQIKSYGHDIGLHFDSGYFNVANEEDLEMFLRLDAQYFNAIFKTEVKAFSFHNTNPYILSCEKERYADMINVYSRYFKERFAYCADSTGYWRYESLLDLIKNPKIKKLQVLTHDAMWSDEILSPRQRIFESIEEHSQRLKKLYDTGLAKLGAKNVDWDNVYE